MQGGRACGNLWAKSVMGMRRGIVLMAIAMLLCASAAAVSAPRISEFSDGRRSPARYRDRCGNCGVFVSGGKEF
jgi:hypothetical protein